MRRLLFAILVLWQLCLVPAVLAHPVPISSVDLVLEGDRIDGTLTMHAADLARELRIDQPQTLLDRRVLASQYTSINAFLRKGLVLRSRAALPLSLAITGLAPLPDEAAIEVRFTAAGPPPPALEVDAILVPADPLHRTFVNIRKGGVLVQQFLFAAGSEARVHYAGTAAGAWAALSDFAALGTMHVWLGFDHLAFVAGLVLLGGGLRRLALIVTAFTLGHSLTLALAALDLVVLPSWMIEPAIALSIIVVGADNLLRGLEPGGQGRDYRAGFAALFGLVHGFGFAFVLREMGLPPGNLAVSLLGFNLGVEVAGLAVVILLAIGLSVLRRRAGRVAKRIERAGSLAVIAAGLYWFFARLRDLAV